MGKGRKPLFTIPLGTAGSSLGLNAVNKLDNLAQNISGLSGLLSISTGDFTPQDVAAVQESTRQPIGNPLTFQEARTNFSPNETVLQEQLAQKPAGTTLDTGLTVGNRLPFLKGRNIRFDAPKVEETSVDPPLLQGIKNAITSFGEGGRRMLEGVKSILDEPFNGLDSIGRELVIDILTKFSQNRQVWVVDHASETKAMFNQVVRIEKRGGVSKIV